MPLLNKPQTEWDDHMIRSSRPRRWWRSKRLWVWVAIGVVAVLIVALSAKYIAV